MYARHTHELISCTAMDGTQYSLPVFLRHLVCFPLSITFTFGLAEDAAAAADLALAAAVAGPAERAPSSCQQPPADHVKQAEGKKRGGGGEEDDRDGDSHHPGFLCIQCWHDFLTFHPT